jgi:hypothetical protein
MGSEAEEMEAFSLAWTKPAAREERVAVLKLDRAARDRAELELSREWRVSLDQKKLRRRFFPWRLC